MKVSIIGTGYVGLVTGACLAEIGNHVFCLDVDERKIGMLNEGEIPIHEPGLEGDRAQQRAGRAPAFTTDAEASVAHGELQFIAVGTPPDEDGSADLQYVLAAARNIGRHMDGFKVIVDKSTVPVGTADKVRDAVDEELKTRGAKHEFAVVSNPEFLKEGAAVEDFMRPDRIVIGADDARRASPRCAQLYAPFQRNHERMHGHGRALGGAHQVRGQRDARHAHLVHERARATSPRRSAPTSSTCAAASAPTRASATTSSTRARATAARASRRTCRRCCARARGARPSRCACVRAVEEANERRSTCSSRRSRKRFGADLQGAALRALGPRLQAQHRRHARGAEPRRDRRAARARRHGARLRPGRDGRGAPASSANEQRRVASPTRRMDALEGADALVIVTEWKEFRSPDFDGAQERR